MSKKRKMEEQFVELTEQADPPPPSPLVVTVDFAALLERYEMNTTAVFGIIGDLKDLLR